MTTESNGSGEKDSESESTINRRSVLKAAGVAAVGAGTFAGNASANQYNFYGCSQVCTDNRGNYAVVVMEGGGFNCVEITEESNRNDPPVRDFTETGTGVYCLSVDDVDGGVAIAGACDNASRFVPNYSHGEGSVESKSEVCGGNYFEGDVPEPGDPCPCL